MYNVEQNHLLVFYQMLTGIASDCLAINAIKEDFKQSTIFLILNFLHNILYMKKYCCNKLAQLLSNWRL